MSRQYQVPHHTVHLLLIAAVWAVLPTLLRGPVILLVGTLLILGWRWQIARMRLPMPGRMLRIGLLCLLTALTAWHYHTIFGPAAGVSLLAGAFALKTLEMFRLRDAYVVVLLGYFVLAMVFLFHRSLPMTLYVAVGVVLITAVLIGINQPDDSAKTRRHLKRAGVLCLQALPLLLISFVIVPRVAPIWGLSLGPDNATTGLSGSMSPGQISHLSQSSEPVFRVEFNGAIPPPWERYWRALTYSTFDGSTWSRASTPQRHNPSQVHYANQPSPRWLKIIQAKKQGKAPTYQYRVLLEPTDRHWLFSLAVGFSNTPDVGMARDFRLVSRNAVHAPMAYRVRSYDVPRDLMLSPRQRRMNLALPSSGNPETRALVRKWRQQYPDDGQLILRIMRWFHNAPFYYTLHPDKMMGANSIDTFLFHNRRGFCEHYASAFAYIMRLAGIPARIVAGYQGGEINPMGNYLQVRKYDAHAWVEVWLQGKGWVREDPTAAVAPSRIESGLLSALSENDEPAGAHLLQWNGGLIGRLSMVSNYVTFVWQRWVLSYDQDSQQALFTRWFSGMTLMKVLAAVAIVLLLLAGAVIGWTRWQYRKTYTDWQWQYRRVYKALAKRGVDVNKHQSPKQLMTQAVIAFPEKRRDFSRWLAAYQALAYRPCTKAETKKRLKRLKDSYPL